MSKEKEVIQIGNGQELEVDPNFIIDSIDDVNSMVNGHKMILEAMKSMIERATKMGIKPDAAAAISMEFQRRAGKKANSMVHMEDPEKKGEEAEKEEKTDDGAGA